MPTTSGARTLVSVRVGFRSVLTIYLCVAMSICNFSILFSWKSKHRTHARLRSSRARCIRSNEMIFRSSRHRQNARCLSTRLRMYANVCVFETRHYNVIILCFLFFDSRPFFPPSYLLFSFEFIAAQAPLLGTPVLAWSQPPDFGESSLSGRPVVDVVQYVHNIVCIIVY